MTPKAKLTKLLVYAYYLLKTTLNEYRSYTFFLLAGARNIDLPTPQMEWEQHAPAPLCQTQMTRMEG